MSLLPRDPEWALALWEIDAQSLEVALHGLTAAPTSSASLQLRVYPIEAGRGRPPRALRAYAIDTWTGQRPVLLDQPGQLHQAAVGLVDRHGAFTPIARSRRVLAPSAGSSPDPSPGPNRVPGSDRS